MSLKHLLPTFRNRFNFIVENIEIYNTKIQCRNMLNVGTGEGDYDRYLSRHTEVLTACDINVGDIDQAKTINKEIPNIVYEVKDALNTGYADGSFDVIVCTEVIEHVGNPGLLLKEINRILAEDGIVMITFPSKNFPITYDPINYISQKLGKTNPIINQGAYAFGHQYLIDCKEFLILADEAGLQIESTKGLSGYLIGFLEMYWTGIFQYFFKSNSRNINESNKNPVTLKTKSSKIPFLAKITDLVIKTDFAFFTKRYNTIGIGVVLVKKSNVPS